MDHLSHDVSCFDHLLSYKILSLEKAAKRSVLRLRRGHIPCKAVPEGHLDCNKHQRQHQSSAIRPIPIGPLRVLCATFFCQKIPAFWSANLGQFRLISAKIGQKSAKLCLKFDWKSTKSQLKSTKWGLFISHLRVWGRTPKDRPRVRESSKKGSLKRGGIRMQKVR